MTMPTLINNTKNKELETALTKAYSITSQALVMMSAYEGEVSSKYSSRTFASLYVKYFNNPIFCGYGTSLEKPCVKTSDYRNYNNTSTANGAYLDDGQFLLPDGMIIFIQNEPGDASADRNNTICITIDVNGVKRPNQWGHDLFTFQLMENGILAPMGQEGTDFYEKECSETSTSSRNGIGCTYKALTDKDYWKKF